MTVIDTICTEVDRAFAEIEGLAERYPDAPAAKGQPTSSLKTFVTDRAGHDRRYAIDETKARGELGYARPCAGTSIMKRGGGRCCYQSPLAGEFWSVPPGSAVAAL